MLQLDLQLLENDRRFEKFCYDLIQIDFPGAIPLFAGSWDGGRDILYFDDSNSGEINFVWQCKYTQQANTSSLKQKVIASLESLNPEIPILKWVLCLSSEYSGVFFDWLWNTIHRFNFIKSFEIWGKTQLLRRLEKQPELLHMYFYRSYKELEQYFCTEELELVKFDIDTSCGWTAHDKTILSYRRQNTKSRDTVLSDIVFDIIVRNRGNLEALLQSITVEVSNVQRKLRGFPGDALLNSKITYDVCIEGGQNGEYSVKAEPPLIIKPRCHERLSVRCTDVFYAWVGNLRIILGYGLHKRLDLPWVKIRA